MPPCCFTPFGSPLTMTGMVTWSTLVHRDAVEVGVQHLVRDRIELDILHQHAASPAPASFSEISVFAPDSECRIFSSAFGSTAIGVALPCRSPP